MFDIIRIVYILIILYMYYMYHVLCNHHILHPIILRFFFPFTQVDSLFFRNFYTIFLMHMLFIFHLFYILHIIHIYIVQIELELC